MVAFNKQRIQYDDETKRKIFDEYCNTRMSMVQVAEKYNLNVNTVNNIVKKFRAQKKKEEQFFKDNVVIQNKPKQQHHHHQQPTQQPPKQQKTYDSGKSPLNVTQEVKRIEQQRKPVQPKPTYDTQPKKPQNELRKSARREKIVINTSQEIPVEPFRPRPPKTKDIPVHLDKPEKKLDRRSSIANIVDQYFKHTFGE